MKKIMLCCLALFIFQSSILFAQEDHDEGSAAKLIMKTTGFTPYPFRLFDGTPLDYKDIYTLTSDAPGNSSLIKDAKPWRVVSIIMAGASLASCLFQVYDLAFPETFENLRFRNMAGLTTFSLFAGSIGAGMIYQDKLQKSVNNYNLYIMGIPVN
jgi:hypothetical protein